MYFSHPALEYILCVNEPCFKGEICFVLKASTSCVGAQCSSVFSYIFIKCNYIPQDYDRQSMKIPIFALYCTLICCRTIDYYERKLVSLLLLVKREITWDQILKAHPSPQCPSSPILSIEYSGKNLGGRYSLYIFYVFQTIFKCLLTISHERSPQQKEVKIDY